MSQKPQVQPAFQSIKSLPVDFRFIGSPLSDQVEKSDDVNFRHSDVTSLSVPENGELGNEFVEEGENEESPYCGNNIVVEDRPSVGDEDLDSAASPSPLPSVSASHTDRRWSDTTSYAGKKVFFGFCLMVITNQNICCFTSLCIMIEILF